MISLTMSRISSRAEFGVELGELAEIDRLDQRAEDRALGLVIGFGAAGIERRRAGCGVRRRTACRRGAPESARRDRRTGTACGRLRRRGVPAAGARRRCRRGARLRRRSRARRLQRARKCATLAKHELNSNLVTTTSSAAFRSAATAELERCFFGSARPVSFCARCRKISACDGSRKSRRSSGRYWPPRRKPAARTG